MNKLVHLAMRAVNHITNEGHARHGRMLSVSPGAIQKFLSWYLRPEIHPASERIRIICISGEKLFGARETNQDRPLGEWARRGKLDVVMPVSRADNPTISERAQRYCECRHQKALIRWCVAVPSHARFPMRGTSKTAVTTARVRLRPSSMALSVRLRLMFAKHSQALALAELN